MIFQLGVWLCSFHSHGYWSKSTAETSMWADTCVPKTTETEWKPHSQPALGSKKDPTKADAWKAPSLSVSGADPPDAHICWAHHQKCSLTGGPHHPLSLELCSPGAAGPGRCLSRHCLVTASGPPQTRGNVGGWRYPRSPALRCDSSEGHL